MWHDAENPGCPFTAIPPDVDGKRWPPPYALIPRLNGLSARLRAFLTNVDGAGNPVALTPFIYTSKRVLQVWIAGGNPAPHT